MNLENCPACGRLFVRTPFRDICPSCYEEEERQFQIVAQFLRRRENRLATMEQIVEATGVPEALLVKFIKSGRLTLAQLPNLGYPCDRCGKLIREGRMCSDCSKDLQGQLEAVKKEEKRKQNESFRTYYADKERNGR
ncbi:hypothetical protein M493_16300 [Geobacillus genomosp. 3]|uniref:Flagellar protein n=1 Tax=Geobacillus genomosp. 3 TaxID=1921421 RepID=S5Z338_GEOG3|nr:TIGR03826 family flagellar region protein [Geobacillus genomosp. 3]AGT33474.1 hypothetical protein M493_16300 [Geobacillus genomosp. 3]